MQLIGLIRLSGKGFIMGMGKGKKVPVIAISIGMAEMPKGKKKHKAAMMRGGMANGKEHMYAVGGNVTDKMNKGLRALNKEAPEVVAKMLGK